MGIAISVVCFPSASSLFCFLLYASLFVCGGFRCVLSCDLQDDPPRPCTVATFPAGFVVDQLFANQSRCVATGTAECGGGAYAIGAKERVFPKGHHFIRLGLGVTQWLGVDSTGQVFCKTDDYSADVLDPFYMPGSNTAQKLDVGFAQKADRGGLLAPVDVSAGNEHKAILFADGRLFMWGPNT